MPNKTEGLLFYYLELASQFPDRIIEQGNERNYFSLCAEEELNTSVSLRN